MVQWVSIMKFLVAEPIFNACKLCSFATYGPERQFEIQQISKTNSLFPDEKKYNVLCFDALRLLDIGLNFSLSWDVKTLYELSGYKFDNLISLGTQVVSMLIISNPKLQRNWRIPYGV